MIEKLIPNLNCSELANQTSFEVVNTISRQPYYLAGFIIIIAFQIIMWFIFGFAKVHPQSRKVCFESFIHNKFLIIILSEVVILILWFYMPFHFVWIGG